MMGRRRVSVFGIIIAIFSCALTSLLVFRNISFADSDTLGNLYSYFYNLSDTDLSQKTADEHAAFNDLLVSTIGEMDVDYAIRTSSSYSCIYVDLPGAGSECITLMSPIYKDLDGLNSLSGVAIMEYLIKEWDTLESNYSVRLIFAPDSFPTDLCEESSSVFVLGALAGGDRLFSYDLGNSSAEDAVGLVCARNGIVYYKAPERFAPTGIPQGLETYAGAVYLERSLWWYDGSVTNSYVGTRYYQSANSEYADADGYIKGFGYSNLEGLGRAYKGYTGLSANLTTAYSIIIGILTGTDIHLISASGNDVEASTTIAAADPIIQPSTPAKEESETTTAEETTAGVSETEVSADVPANVEQAEAEISTVASSETLPSVADTGSSELNLNTNPLMSFVWILVLMILIAAVVVLIVRGKMGAVINSIKVFFSRVGGFFKKIFSKNKEDEGWR